MGNSFQFYIFLIAISKEDDIFFFTKLLLFFFLLNYIYIHQQVMELHSANEIQHSKLSF